MADLGTITWKVAVDTTDLKAADREMDTAKKSADGFEKSAKKAGTTVTTTGKKAKTATGEMSKGFGTAKRAVVGFAAVLGTVGIARSFANAITATNAFNASVSELSAITGAVGEDLTFFAEQSKEIGRTTSLSASQAATAFKLIASAKPDLLESAAALNAVTREAVTLAEAAKIDLAQAADTVGISLNQFAAGADQANRFVNVLAAGSKFGASAIAETSMALKNSGAAANAAGLSFEETNAAIQALAAGGIKAGEAGTGLRNVILILEQELDDNLKPSVVGISTAMENLAEKELTITEMTEIFGRQNVVAAQTLVDNAEAVGKLETALTGTTVATEQARINMDNLAGDILEGKSATEGLQIALGERLTPRLREARQGMTEFTNSVTQFVESDDFEKWVKAATIGLQILSAVLVTKVVVSLGATALAMGAATTATAAFGGALTLVGGPIGVVVAALTALTLAYKDVQEIQETAVSNAVDQIASSGQLGLAIQGVTDDIQELAMQMAIMDQSAISNNEEYNRLYLKRIELTEFLSGLIDAQTVLQDEQNAKDAEAITVRFGLQKSVGVLNTRTLELVRTDNDLLSVGKLLNPNLRGTEFRIRGVNIRTEEYTETVQDLLDAMDQEIEDLGRTDRELFILNATRIEGEELTWKEEQAIRAKAAALFDEQAEIKATAAVEAEAQRASEENLRATERESERVAEEMQRQWAATRDTFAGFFMDLFNNGKNAFDSLLSSFKNMVKRMIAEWIASGIMKMLDMGGGGATAAGGFSLLGGGGGGGGGGGLVSSFLGGGSGAGGTGLIGGAAATASQFLGGLTGTAVGTGSALVGPPTAAAAAGAGLGGTLGAIGSNIAAFATNPITLALLGAGILAKTLDPSGTFSHNAGFLTQDLGAVDASRKFDIPEFASGAQFTGFNRRTTQEEAGGVVDIFRAYDAALTEAALAAGITPNLNASDFVGLDEKGQGRGAFFGSASEDEGGVGQDIESQLDRYASRWIELVGAQAGVSQADITSVIGGGDAESILSQARQVAGIDGSFAMGIDRIPRDGFIAELHKGEQVLTKREADQQSGNDNSLAEVAGSGSMLYAILKILMRSFRLFQKWDQTGLKTKAA